MDKGKKLTPSQTMGVCAGIVTVCVLMSVSIVRCAEPGQPKPPVAAPLALAERYTGPWVEDFHLGIARALVANDIRGCGYLRYKADVKDTGDYLVECSRDNAHWRGYKVFEYSKEVLDQHD